MPLCAFLSGLSPLERQETLPKTTAERGLGNSARAHADSTEISRVEKAKNELLRAPLPPSSTDLPTSNTGVPSDFCSWTLSRHSPRWQTLMSTDLLVLQSAGPSAFISDLLRGHFAYRTHRCLRFAIDQPVGVNILPRYHSLSPYLTLAPMYSRTSPRASKRSRSTRATSFLHAFFLAKTCDPGQACTSFGLVANTSHRSPLSAHTVPG